MRPPALRAAVFFIAPVLRAAFAVDLRTAVAARLAGALRAVDLRVVVLRVVVLRVAVLRVADLRAGDLRAEAFRAVVLRALEDLRAAVFRPAAFQGVLVKEADLENTLYRFELEDGSVLEVKGNEQIEYDGDMHTAANLFDALKEGYYGKF